MYHELNACWGWGGVVQGLFHEKASKSVWNIGIYGAIYSPASSVLGFQSLLLNGTEGNRKLNHII